MAKQIGELMVHLSGIFFRKTLKTVVYEQGNFVALVHEGHELLRLTGDEQGAFLNGQPFQCALGTVQITPREMKGNTTPMEAMMKLLQKLGGPTA